MSSKSQVGHKKKMGHLKRPHRAPVRHTASPQPSSLDSILQRAKTDPNSLTSPEILQLQRVVGNRSVGQLLKPSADESPHQRNAASIQKSRHRTPAQSDSAPKTDKTSPISPATVAETAVIQRVQIVINGRKKEIADLTEDEMEQFLRNCVLKDDILSAEAVQDIEGWLKGRRPTKKIRVIRGYFYRCAKEEGVESYTAKPKKKKKRGKKRPRVEIYDNSDSELSESEEDFEPLYKKKKVSMTGAYNRTHVPQPEDIEENKELAFTGLSHSDTFLLAFQGGHFVPRTIRGKPNRQARRKRLPEQKFSQWSKDATDSQKSEKEREGFRFKLIDAQKQILFGNSIDWDKGERSEKLVKAQEALRKKLYKRKDQSALTRLIKAGASPGLRSGSKKVTGTDAEQKLLASGVWEGMLARLKEAMAPVAERNYKVLGLARWRISLLLNRSSCLGCGKVLAIELIRFWTEVAEILELGSWQEAKNKYDHLGLFRISFPVTYEYDKEKKIKFRNIKTILAGLREAGWDVRIVRGIPSNPHAQANYEKTKELVKKQRQTQYQGLVQKITGFLMKEKLKLGDTVKDGNCLYDAIRSQLLKFGIDADIQALRQRVAQLVVENQEHFAQFATNQDILKLIEQISRMRSWNNQGGDMAAQIIATVLQRDVIVITPDGIDVRKPDANLDTSRQSTLPSDGTPIVIAYDGFAHYWTTENG